MHFLEEETSAGKVAQWVEELATKLPSLSLNPRTHSEVKKKKKKKPDSESCPLTSTHNVVQRAPSPTGM